MDRSRFQRLLLMIVKRHKKFIAWYQKKLGLSNYGLLWLVFFKGFFVAWIVALILK